MQDLPKKKAIVIINHEYCKLCGICINFCPVKNLSIENRKLLEWGKCTGCRKCVLHCPDFALNIKLIHGQETIRR